MNKVKFQENYKKYLTMYKYLHSPYSEELSKVAEDYDTWFNGEFLNGVRSECIISKGKLLPSPVEAYMPLIEAVSNKASEIIFPPMARYMVDHFDEFYGKGLYLAKFNADIEGKEISLDLDEDDKIVIENLLNTELEVWKNHIVKHKRQVDRELVGAMEVGFTVEQFMSRMTAPDGHIVAYPYGNGRISWGEHIRRFLAGRPRMVATMAQMRRTI